MTHESPLPGQVLIKVDQFSDSEGHYNPTDEKREPVTDIRAANAIASRTFESLLSSDAVHKPVLDIDIPGSALIPSSTPGHFHLYLNRELTWANYAKLLTVLGEVGLLQKGYVDASLNRGYSAVRLPWITKDTIPPVNGELAF